MSTVFDEMLMSIEADADGALATGLPIVGSVAWATGRAWFEFRPRTKDFLFKPQDDGPIRIRLYRQNKPGAHAIAKAARGAGSVPQTSVQALLAVLEAIGRAVARAKPERARTRMTATVVREVGSIGQPLAWFSIFTGNDLIRALQEARRA